jgi:glyoxylase-like metal-dependent hydrolase (beta-lactamase superfamily II)/ferredoxin
MVAPGNVAGEWFVDTRCIDCDACRQLAPEVFVRRGGQSVVGAQPCGVPGGDGGAGAGSGAEASAWRAALTCPTQSIGTRPHRPAPGGLLPLEIEDDVWFCGFNSADSYGAGSYFVSRPGGNVLVDSPRFTRRLAGPLAERGGIDHVLLTHQDDVADADRWADRFGARVWIHEDDARAAPFATDLFEGTGPTPVTDGLVAFPVPGHTRGSMAFVLEERFLFSGDSLAWDRDRGDLTAFEDVAWYSWPTQARSLAGLAEAHRFEWVLPGHGARGHRPAEEMHARLTALARRMAA